MNNMIMVTSASDWTLVMDLPELNLRRTWTKRGASYPIDKDALQMAMYNPAIEALFKEGSLFVEDKEFMKSFGLMKEDDTPVIPRLDDALMTRIISVMPLSEVKTRLKEMSPAQINDLAEFAVAHYEALKMDRIDLLSKVSGRNIMRSIENYKADKAN